MVFFANSGTEAVEAGLKLARAATRRPGLLSCERSFHGKSLGSLSVTGNGIYQRPFGPLLPECQAVPFGDLPALERALHTRRFAAFIVEPIQGEGGMIVPPAGYLRAAQELCRSTGTLLIVDEVQTGLGRTGTLFAVDEEGVEPDVLTLAKSLGGGLVPLGAMLCRRDLWMKAYGSAQTFALHTSTFGGGSLACAAGLAALRVLRDEDLCATARARGQQLQQGLQELSGRCDLVRGVRGRGLMLGLEFHPMPDTMVAHFKGMDPSGATALLVPNLDDLIHSIPGPVRHADPAASAWHLHAGDALQSARAAYPAAVDHHRGAGAPLPGGAGEHLSRVAIPESDGGQHHPQVDRHAPG